MKIIISTCFSLITLSIFSCRKFVQIPSPKNEIITSTVFSDSTNATTAVLGIYIGIMQQFTSIQFSSGAVSAYTALSGDEMSNTSGNSDLMEFYSDRVSPLDNLSNDAILWGPAYKTIYQINACLEGVNGSSGLSDAWKNQLLGELLFDRAFMYFNLINLYGDVPYLNSTDYKINASKPRTPADTIYSQIIADLTSSQNLMSVNYISDGRARPNQLAATSLLARVYLYQKNWAQAKSSATKVISSNLYSLQGLDTIFLSGNNEAIWQLSPVFNGWETPEGFVYIPRQNTVIPTYVISPYLLAAFEMGDKRMENWLDSNVANGIVYYYPDKYKIRGHDGSSPPGEMEAMLRLGEQFLIRAESAAELGDSADAIIDLNAIRFRAGLPAYSEINQGPLLQAIQHERQVELFCEWGHRWFDLKRTGSINNILGIEKGSSWKSTAALYPIPESELEANPFLTQNPGY